MTTAVDVKEELNNTDPDNYEPDAYFEPIISLPLIDRVTLEEDEEVLLKLRAKLYRFDSTELPPMWKERGTGEVKLLHHSTNHTVRVVMRRDKTLKICANHFIASSMKLERPNKSRKNSWIWSVSADYADEVAKSEIFAIKFISEENADLWKIKFIEGQSLIQSKKANIKPQNEKPIKSEIDDSSELENEDTENAKNKSTINVEIEGLPESILNLSIDKSDFEKETKPSSGSFMNLNARN